MIIAGSNGCCSIDTLPLSGAIAGAGRSAGPEISASGSHAFHDFRACPLRQLFTSRFGYVRRQLPFKFCRPSAQLPPLPSFFVACWRSLEQTLPSPYIVTHWLQLLCYLRDCAACLRLERLPGGTYTTGKRRLFHGAPPNPTSIFTRKRDTLRVTLGIQSDRGEPRTMERKSVLRPVAGAIAAPPETLPVQPF
jgi:hypothetical protein